MKEEIFSIVLKIHACISKHLILFAAIIRANAVPIAPFLHLVIQIKRNSSNLALINTIYIAKVTIEIDFSFYIPNH